LHREDISEVETDGTDLNLDLVRERGRARRGSRRGARVGDNHGGVGGRRVGGRVEILRGKGEVGEAASA
jgi:hypothetical protein